MARVYIALIYVAVLLRACQAAATSLDAIDFMHVDDKGDIGVKCRDLPTGIASCLASPAPVLLWSRDA